MIASDFPQANQTIGEPQGWDRSQCQPIRAFVCMIDKGNLEGSPAVVTAWKPTEEEIKQIVEGGLIYVAFISDGLPPHFLATHCPYEPIET